MHGNVSEWCKELSEPDPEARLRVGPSGKLGMLRGGSYADHTENCRSACRFAFDADARSGAYGFRVVMRLP
jgi:formylglycine-generating enzyme required for sulfatase activity